MIIGGRRAPFLLFLGDVVSFCVSLLLTLVLRYGAWPSLTVLNPYVAPFALLFAVWILVFYMAGLYSKRLALFPSRVPDALLATQLVNIVLAALFFFFITAFGIAPKTILVLYLVISLPLIYIWRLEIYPHIVSRSARYRAALVASGAEAEELVREVNSNPRYGVEFIYVRKPQSLPAGEVFRAELAEAQVSLLVVDADQADASGIDPIAYLPALNERRCQCARFEDFYEETFDRIPLSRLNQAWFLRHARPASGFYLALKRGIDLIGGVLMGIITILATPVIFVANLFDSPGSLFIRQERFGQYGKLVVAYKFRSMRLNKAASDEWTVEEQKDNPVTRVGNFLRKTSLDEFPQFINILAGTLSLVGPRNDILGLGERLRDALPYYQARYLVKPGITGWAQINQQYEPGNTSPQSIKETKTRLAYDFYYLKHRSLALDIVIALKTVKRMFFRLSSW